MPLLLILTYTEHLYSLRVLAFLSVPVTWPFAGIPAYSHSQFVYLPYVLNSDTYCVHNGYILCAHASYTCYVHLTNARASFYYLLRIYTSYPYCSYLLPYTHKLSIWVTCTRLIRMLTCYTCYVYLFVVLSNRN